MISDEDRKKVTAYFTGSTKSRTIDGYNLINTCMACPEQYDVYKNGEKVGYLRLRHGYFRADAPYGNTVYEAEPEGDGMFEPDERDGYLAEAIKAIKEMSDD